MAALSLSIDAIRPMNRWDHDSIRPGPQGSVGDVLLTERLKASLPGDFRWEQTGYGELESVRGSNVQDGSQLSYEGNGPPRLLDTNWGGRRTFQTNHGWIFQNIQPEDKMVTSIMGSTGQYDWKSRVATIVKANQKNPLFSMPSGINGPAKGLTRGGQYPRITDVIEGDEPGFSPITTNSYQPNYKPGDSTPDPRAQEQMGLGNFRSQQARLNTKRR